MVLLLFFFNRSVYLLISTLIKSVGSPPDLSGLWSPPFWTNCGIWIGEGAQWFQPLGQDTSRRKLKVVGQWSSFCFETPTHTNPQTFIIKQWHSRCLGANMFPCSLSRKQQLDQRKERRSSNIVWTSKLQVRWVDRTQHSIQSGSFVGHGSWLHATSHVANDLSMQR